jgi:hypothetical protein
MWGVIMCLPSQLCQIPIDSDQVSGKLNHDRALFPHVNNSVYSNLPK